MQESERYTRALAFAARKHEGQTRKEGIPYITHPKAVARILRDKGYGEAYQIAGLFHDLLEDTDASPEEIEALGGEEVLQAVILVTKRPGYSMETYVSSIRENPIARAVKAADRLHNLTCAIVCDEAFRRKYVKESEAWYLDFDPEILPAVERLKLSLPSEAPQ